MLISLSSTVEIILASSQEVALDYVPDFTDWRLHLLQRRGLGPSSGKESHKGKE